ncbi:MAG TPA: ABC transporter permease [Pyrinomonadaceae bacterium]|nr:ABC transporter permease [Pyrinomonadaceae bacterium]
MSGILTNISEDIRFATRLLVKNRSFAITAILALALGSSVAISVYTLLYGLALRPFPVKDAENVMKIYQEIHESTREMAGSPYMFSHEEYTHYRDNNKSFSQLIAYAENTFSLGGGEAQKVPGLFVTTNYFPALGATMVLGRSFEAEEGATPGTHPVAIISNRLWKETFNSDPGIMGKPAIVNGVSLTVVGVAAPDTAGTELTVPDIWVPLMMEPQLTQEKNLPKENCSWLTLVGRLKDGVSIKQAQSEMAVLASQLDTFYLDRKTTITVSRGAYLGNPEEASVMFKVLFPMTLAVAFILLIVCTNVSNLFLARAAGRQKELGMRAALGATRSRLIQQLLTESLLVGIIGGVLGLVFATGLLKLFKLMIPLFPPQLSTTPDLTIFACALLIAFVAGLGSGLIPAFSQSRVDLNSLIKEETMGSGARKGSLRLRNLLLAVQLAGCLLLLISTSLLVRGLQNARRIDLGFQPNNLYLVNLDLRQQRYDADKAALFYQRLKAQLEGTPGVKSTSLAAVPPLLVRNQTEISLDRRGVDKQNLPTVYYNVVSPNYFDTMGISLLRGRAFTEQDAQTDAHLAVISEAMANRYWPGQDPVGSYFDALDQRLQVVAVAKNIRNVKLMDEKTPFFYALAGRDKQLELNPVLRVDAGNVNLSNVLNNTVHSIDPRINVSIRSMEQSLDQLLQPSRMSILLTSALGLLAMIISAVGVYGVTSYAASQRTKEIGIRMALGAQHSSIIFLFIKQGVWSLVIGIVFGLGLAALASFLLSDLLFGVNGLDPIAFLVATTFLTFIALIAMYLPVARAARMHVMSLIR